MNALIPIIGVTVVGSYASHLDALGPFPDGNSDRVLYDIVRD